MKIFQKKMMNRKLVRNLNGKEKYSPYDCDDFDYHGIRDI